jgi:hypothetical protein
MKKFYLVYNVKEEKVYGSFDTLDEAVENAEHLAESNVEKEFYICSGLYGYKSRVIVTKPEFLLLDS